MAPRATQPLHFDPNGPGMGLDIDFADFDSDVANFGFNNNTTSMDSDFKFNNFDLGTGLDSVNNGMNYNVNFNFEETLKEAESSLGPREPLQEANTDMNSHSHLPPSFPKLTNKNSDALTQAEASTNPGTSTNQDSVHFNEMRVQKRKKMDEVDECRILPEGSRRNRNKTARARGLD